MIKKSMAEMADKSSEIVDLKICPAVKIEDFAKKCKEKSTAVCWQNTVLTPIERTLSRYFHYKPTKFKIRTIISSVVWIMICSG